MKFINNQSTIYPHRGNWLMDLIMKPLPEKWKGTDIEYAEGDTMILSTTNLRLAGAGFPATGTANCPSAIVPLPRSTTH
jgi:hypothetical protein